MKRLIVDEKQEQSAKERRRGLAVPLFIWGSLIYDELLLMLGRASLSPLTLLYALLFSVPAAALIYLLSTLFRRERINTVILAVIMLITAVFFGIEYFCKVFFTHYMSLGSILSGTGGVLTDFFDVVVRLVLKGLWMVLP